MIKNKKLTLTEKFDKEREKILILINSYESYRIELPLFIDETINIICNLFLISFKMLEEKTLLMKNVEETTKLTIEIFDAAKEIIRQEIEFEDETDFYRTISNFFWKMENKKIKEAIEFWRKSENNKQSTPTKNLKYLPLVEYQ